MTRWAKNRWRASAAAICGVLIAPWSLPAVAAVDGAASAPLDRTVLPIMPRPFAGIIGKTPVDSRPDFPSEVTAPRGAPNVLLVMTDDVGFAGPSTFGGLIPTPNLDKLANGGVKLNNFHTTAMCSPTRAALLTGRNHHNVAFGSLTDFAAGYPGYSARMPKSAVSIGEILTQNGVSTAFFGKHHNVPKPHTSAAGPFDQWPTGLGFEYFYGFVGADTDQWRPSLYRGTSRVSSTSGDVLDKKLADDAIRWIHNQKAMAPDKPFFIYYAPGTNHAPHQAPADWIARFRGQFDQGWDKAREQVFERQKKAGIIPADTVMAPRPDSVPAWDSLSPARKKVAARLMEVYAAQLAYQDFQLGRIVDELKRIGQFDNTLILFVSGDNGGTAEGGPNGTSNNLAALANKPEESDEWMLSQMDKFGGPDSHANYPSGWAWVVNTPFPLFKRFASHFGGMRNGFVASWPKEIPQNGDVRTQFAHVIDVVPTILDAMSIPAPQMVNGVEQKPMDGASLMEALRSKTAPAPRDQQYFELLGNRGIYKDGWFASTTPPRKSLDMRVTDAPTGTDPALGFEWSLYDLRTDFGQARDLSKEYPQKLKEMQALWDSEAVRYHVYPIDSSVSDARLSADEDAHARNDYTFWGANISIPAGAAPPILRKSYSLRARLDVPSNTAANGVIMAYGNGFAGWSFYLKDGKPIVHQSFSEQPQHQFVLTSEQAIPAGQSEVGLNVDYAGGGADVSIVIGDKVVARSRFPQVIAMTDLSETFDIGQDSDHPVSADYPEKSNVADLIRRVDLHLKTAK